MRLIVIFYIFISIFLQYINAQSATIILEESDSTLLDLKFINDTIIKVSFNQENSDNNFIAKYDFNEDTLNVYNKIDLEIFDNVKVFLSKEINRSNDSVEVVFYCFSHDYFYDDEIFSKLGFDSIYVELNQIKYYMKYDSKFKVNCKSSGDIFHFIKIKKSENNIDLNLYTKHGKLIIEKKINLENKNKIMIRGLYYEGYYKIFTAEPKNVYVNDKRYFLKFI